MHNAVAAPHPLGSASAQLDESLEEALQWLTKRSPRDIIADREAVTVRIETAAEEFRRNGSCRQWFYNCDDCCAQISADVNGPLAEYLAKLAHSSDPTAFDYFRYGGPVVGRLPRTGCGDPCDYAPGDSVDELFLSCRQRNEQLLNTLHTDTNARVLIEHMKADAEKGRMTDPRPLCATDLDSVLFSRRFSREQGMRADGTRKIRSVDDETASGTNGCCIPGERLHNDRLDKLVACIQRFIMLCGSLPTLWKADIDAAYRRVPVMPAHRWLLWVAVYLEGTTYVSRHNSMPFGCIGSVHAWNRVGAFLAHIAIHLLHLPLLRYVDDYFTLDHGECAEHGMRCFARVVECLLGRGALAADKLECGMPLEILGIIVSVEGRGVSLWPSPHKMEKWLLQIREAIACGTLSAGDASKLVGRLSFGAQHIFRKLGRAMLRPLYCQQYSPLAHGRIGPTLHLALQWWCTVLQQQIHERIPLAPKARAKVDLFCDARGHPARVAAVCCSQNQIKYTAWDVPSSVLRRFRERKDAQIMGLELLAIVVGITTFMEEVMRVETIALLFAFVDDYE